MKKLASLIVGVGLTVSSLSAVAANQLHIPDDFFAEGSTVHDWSAATDTIIKDSTNFNYYEIDVNKNKTDYYVFDTYEFTLDQAGSIDFSVWLDNGQGSFSTLKINLFTGDGIELDSLPGLADTSDFTALTNYSPEGEVSSDYYLDQLSMASGTSHFYGDLDAGSYYLTLSGKIKGESSNYSISTLSVSPVPEPSTYALMLAGLGLVGFMARRRKQV